MRVPIFCNSCRYLFHLPVTNLAFLRLCPSCYGPREDMIAPARGPEYSPRNNVKPKSEPVAEPVSFIRPISQNTVLSFRGPRARG